MKNTVNSFSLSGTIRVPASKSYAQRALYTALLAKGESCLRGITWSDDTLHAAHAILSLGAQIRTVGPDLYVTASRTPRTDHIYIAESGLSARMLSALLLIYPGKMELHGAHGLLQRPMDSMVSVYEQLGVDYNLQGRYLPLRLIGPQTLAPITVDGSESSQHVSGLLLALAALNYGHELRVERITSRPYIDMTIAMLRSFGAEWKETSEGLFHLAEGSALRSTRYEIEGDWSGASYPIAGAVISGDLSIKGLHNDSLQADRAILTIPGLRYEWKGQDLYVPRQDLAGFTFDATHCPDLFPALVAMATYATGPSTITGTSRLRHKESNRSQALQSEYGKLGVRIDLSGDEMIIHPSTPQAAVVDSHNDHRIAMSLAIAASRAAGPITIERCEAVSKSYPSFHEDFIERGAKFSLE